MKGPGSRPQWMFFLISWRKYMEGCAGVILTGMGSDGSMGIMKDKKKKRQGHGNCRR